jgi:hypothetical protein
VLFLGVCLALGGMATYWQGPVMIDRVMRFGQRMGTIAAFWFATRGQTAGGE